MKTEFRDFRETRKANMLRGQQLGKLRRAILFCREIQNSELVFPERKISAKFFEEVLTEFEFQLRDDFKNNPTKVKRT